MELIKDKCEANELGELYHKVGSARSIIKSVKGALGEPTPNIQRVLRHSEEALHRLQSALSDIDALIRRKR